jgi:hypothetical protein
MPQLFMNHRPDRIQWWNLESRHRFIKHIAHDVNALAVRTPALHSPTILFVYTLFIQMTAIWALPMLHSDCSREDHGAKIGARFGGRQSFILWC